MDRYYIDTRGNDDDAYKEAMQFALELTKVDQNINKVVLLIGTKTQTGWFERLFGRETEKKLFTGVKFEGSDVLFKFETKITFKDTDRDNSLIVISCGLNADDLYKIDDFDSISSIISIPWLPENLLPWIKTWQPQELRGNQTEALPEPTKAVQEAMRRLTRAVNMSTALTNPFDEELAKTYIRALHKYEASLNTEVVSRFLKVTLGWEARAAEKIEKWIDTLNNGKSFKGGAKTGLKDFYKQWQE